MALRSGIGRFFGFLRPRWGVRGSLFAAFAVIAGMAIVISAGGGMVFRHLGRTMLDFSGRDIPRLAASLQLQAQSATLAAQGPGLLASQDADTLNEHTGKVEEIQKLTMDKLGEVIELGADKSVVDALVQGLLEEREKARAEKDWARADAIRDQLKAAGIEIEDTPEGPKWGLDTTSLRSGGGA